MASAPIADMISVLFRDGPIEFTATQRSFLEKLKTSSFKGGEKELIAALNTVGLSGTFTDRVTNRATGKTSTELLIYEVPGHSSSPIDLTSEAGQSEDSEEPGLVFGGNGGQAAAPPVPNNANAPGGPIVAVRPGAVVRGNKRFVRVATDYQKGFNGPVRRVYIIARPYQNHYMGSPRWEFRYESTWGPVGRRPQLTARMFRRASPPGTCSVWVEELMSGSNNQDMGENARKALALQLWAMAWPGAIIDID